MSTTTRNIILELNKDEKLNGDNYLASQSSVYPYRVRGSWNTESCHVGT